MVPLFLVEFGDGRGSFPEENSRGMAQFGAIRGFFWAVALCPAHRPLDVVKCPVLPERFARTSAPERELRSGTKAQVPHFPDFATPASDER